LFKKQVSAVYKPKHIQQKALETKFYTRSSKLLPSQFFDILLFTAAHSGHCSLSQSTIEIFDKFGITISKQAYDERFDDTAVAFVKSILETQLLKQVEGIVHPDFLKKFTKVRIKDGTRFDLPERLKEYFKGFGGKSTSTSGICIQLEFDLKTGTILEIELTDANKPDNKDASIKAENIEEGELVIRDLGYFVLDAVEKIIQNGAYIISRLNTKTKVYEPNGEEIFFEKVYQWMLQNRITHLEKQVLIGQERKIPVRLILDIVPEGEYQKRMSKINIYNRKKGYQTTDDYKARARFNLFITNIDAKDIPSDEVYTLYKLRWQIELTFKIWKSICGIDKIQPMKYHRFVCTLYAKLILIQINNQLLNTVQRDIYRKFNKLLSKTKCFKTLQEYSSKIRKVLFNMPQKINQLLQEITNMFLRNHWLEKRKGRVNYVEIIELFI
jgi:Transposase DDE domain